MSEGRKTALFGGVALALVLVTWATAPRFATPAIFAERGELLFSEFRDPNSAASLEITEFDARNATIRPFKVQNYDGRWTIPSQHDYPADAKDRLAQTAAALVGLRKDDIASDNAADYERYGVLDPLDTTLPTLNGRGSRLLVRGAHDQVLADVIVGKAVEGHTGFRYLRKPGQKRVYVSNVGALSLSTAFGDWIERDLLQVAGEDIDAVNLRNYSLDRSTGLVNPGETLLLQKAQDKWTINGLGATEELNLNALDAMLRNLAKLRIVGVLPKPLGISATLNGEISNATVSQEDKADLARKGFYLTPTGQLVSNLGEIVVRSAQGVFYTLRFGDIAPESDAPAEDTPPASNGASAPATSPRENRYLFIMVNFDPQSARTPGRASEGSQTARLLRARFAPWYYVIAADSFAKIRVQRRDLVKPKGVAPR